jgi:hypothetical protein
MKESHDPEDGPEDGRAGRAPSTKEEGQRKADWVVGCRGREVEKRREPREVETGGRPSHRKNETEAMARGLEDEDEINRS